MDTPKQRFQNTKHCKVWFDLAVNPDVVAALDYAMLQLTDVLCLTDMNTAAMAGFRMEGARKFVEILKELAVIKEKASKSEVPLNLPEP